MADTHTSFCAFVIYILFGRIPLSAPVCDQTTSANVSEGNIGESEHFPWLGILRVHLHHGSLLKIALTGLVLVKERYAVANSDDISRIPKLVFRQDSKAMFIHKNGDPWYCLVKDYMMHPEYEYTTYNTIALVELALEFGARTPFRPICWPKYFYNTSNQLYAIGYTDDNKLLEKMLYKLQYVKTSLCNEFYKKSGLSEPKSTPSHIQCGFALNNKKDCTWENGMALASNSTGNWSLIGISLRGPGCSAPARFIDLFPYLPWIESATDLVEVSDLDFRRWDGPEDRKPYRHKSLIRTRKKGFKPPQALRDIGLHDPNFTYPYGVDIDSQRPFVINRLDKDAIEIHSFNEMYEKSKGSCSKYKNLVYRDKVRLVEKSQITGEASYRISLYDMIMAGYTCVKLKIHALKRGEAKLWYRYVMDKDAWFEHEGGPTSPKEILKFYPLKKRVRNVHAGPDEPWTPGPHLEATHIIDKNEYEGFRNLNILFWFYFNTEATMELTVYGYAIAPWFPPSSTTPESNIDRRSWSDQELLRHYLTQQKVKNADKDINSYMDDSTNIERKKKPEHSTTEHSSQRFRSYNKYKDQKEAQKSEHSFQSNSSVSKKYRLQKAMLRQAERLAMKTGS